ncbi:condensin complex subunit 2 isoform X1 [Falco peregrinus]|uniref:condensin complex subunit 2 isoform X1 n=1 Tax=Falco peregrinus TaxID=8954 RepID=UPI000FFB47AB|nr:condensin complex subunit 2 isoform X1 [Falco peregrinus]
MSFPALPRAPAASPGPRALGSTGTPVLAECPCNDDEQERRQRRRSKATDLRLGNADSQLSLASSPAPRQAEAWQPAQWSNTQISEHYSTCIKLSNENKITLKNAFVLHLIDYMKEILKAKDSEMTNFKVAAGTIDASAKIYAVRVDVIHADTYKVLGGLGKESASTKNVDSSPKREGSPVPGAVQRVQTKKKHSCKTIEENLNNINVPEANPRCEVDPLFRRTAISFDECSTAGIFLTGLHTQGCHSELLFDSKIVPLPSSETITLPNPDPVKVTDLKSVLAQCIEKRLICSSLAGFHFTKWDAESHQESVSALLDKFQKSDQAFDINAEVDSDVEDNVPTQPDDDFISDSPSNTVAGQTGEFAGNLNSFGTGCQRKGTDVVAFGEGDIKVMCHHLSTEPREYSYFSPRTLSMWAGPEHWRFKPRHTSAASTKEAKKKNAKKAFEINFDEDIDFKTYFRKTKASVVLAKSILENQNTKSTTLPPDFNYDPDCILQLSLKPAVKLWRKPELSSPMDHEDQIGEYDYNNPNDTSNFCPGLQAADSDDDNDPVQFMGQTREFNLTTHPEGEEALLNGVGNGDITVYGELNLIAEPLKINKIEIHYAKTAKKMDMKRLKKNMWDLLTDRHEKVTMAEAEDAEKENTSVVAGDKIFSSITKQLFHSLPSAMANNLSVPLAFACLLHLANEKNLKLEGTEDLCDVLVKQGN